MSDYCLAIATTSRRLLATLCCLAASSSSPPLATTRAKAISSAAVRRGERSQCLRNDCKSPPCVRTSPQFTRGLRNNGLRICRVFSGLNALSIKAVINNQSRQQSCCRDYEFLIFSQPPPLKILVFALGWAKQKKATEFQRTRQASSAICRVISNIRSWFGSDIR